MISIKNAMDILGIQEKSLKEFTVRPELLIVKDEFSKGAQSGVNYRVRAVKKLLGLHIRFSSDQNVLRELARECLVALCPYCGLSIGSLKGGGGNGHTTTLAAACKKCGAEVRVHLPADAGISIVPPREHAQE